ncbi:MAG: hypothetical protein IPJ71_03665 [Bdellovibrionales bacterium]|nr:hypothetical protein [Bdellovibrionales bacterium]
MKEKIRILFTAICLLSTAVVTVATSKKRNNELGYVYVNEITPESLAQRDYLVDSNCPQSIFQEQITVANERVKYPSDLSFLNFGLPSEDVNLTYSNQIVGEVDGVLRSCLRSQQVDQGISLIVYTCSENGIFLCEVFFEEVQ